MKPLAHALLATALAASTAAPARAAASGPVVIASKKFTESVILAEIAAGLLRDAHVELTLRSELGGTRLLWNALRAGDIDLYPDYTGTIRHEILAGEVASGDDALATAAAARGVALTGAIGFNNTYAIGMKESAARKLGVQRISDLRAFPALRFGFSSEFMDRADGWPGLRRHYGLPQASVRGLDHDLAYRGLASDGIDVTDAYSTDAEIKHYRLRVLDDDLGYFPVYQALFVYRTDLVERAPRAIAALERLVGAISAPDMIRMNAAVKIEGRRESAVAAEFLSARFGIESDAQRPGRGGALLERTVEHVQLVAWSLSAAIVVAVPLGIAAARRRRAGQVILAVVGIIQTVPSLALLVFMIPLLGIGTAPALAALFLYSLLPIVRNTHAGIIGIDPSLIESADAMGLPRGARLRRIELPLASPAILAGIKTSAVINIGTATLGALIGAGGYGQPILTGIRLDDTGLILQGAVPAALLALTVQTGFDLLERALVPRGLRLGA
ncbi:MAG: glycine betaine ABC transporter substrate-binding protein [Candidatus Binatia bacterium]